jgi:hypothetical protein
MRENGTGNFQGKFVEIQGDNRKKKAWNTLIITLHCFSYRKGVSPTSSSIYCTALKSYQADYSTPKWGSDILVLQFRRQLSSCFQFFVFTFSDTRNYLPLRR